MARNRPRGRSTQPIRVPTGGAYGDRKAMVDMQRAIPLPASESATAGGPPPTPSRAAGSPPPPVPVAAPTPPDLYAPADTTGPNFPDTLLPDDPVEFLRAVYTMFPSPGLRELIERAARR